MATGITADAPFPGMSGDEWDSVMRTDLDSFYNVLRPLVMPMIQRRQPGRIVTIASVSGLMGNRGQANYAAAKAGILGLTRSLAKELGPKVSVNAICPGVIATDLLRGLLGEREAQLTAGIALGRVGTPEDIASIVRYLAVEAHMFMTGQHFVVDGFQWSC